MYNNVYIKGNIYIYISKYPNLPRDAIVRLTHPQRGDRARKGF